MKELPAIADLLATFTESVRAYAQMRFGALDFRNRLLLVGLHRGGVWLAQELQQRLDLLTALGSLDISFYRDDFATAGLQARGDASQLPVDINGRHVLLVDDILYTGRTIRAAMNELFDYGRPASIGLAVLVARDGRQLPIAPDCCALNVTLPPDQVLKLERGVGNALNLVLRARREQTL